ncbi:MAG: phage tail fiber protein [Christensenellales bacterium]|jgi:hypothetical protein
MITQQTANAILNAFFGRAQYAMLASTCYIGLSTTLPDASGNNFTEPDATTGYSKVMIGNYNQSSTMLMSPATAGTISNTENIIFFPEATSAWGTITHFGIFTSKTSTVPIMWGALTTSISVPSGYIPIFRAGALNVSLQ